MIQKVKILDERNRITRVTEINGARMGDDLFIDRPNLGQPGDIIDVPEFWVETFEGDAAKTFYAETDSLPKLYDLPDYEVDNSGSDLAKAVKAAGYDVSPRNLINGWNCWNLTVAEFVAQLLKGPYEHNR